MKPYVICHMNASVDGRILHSRWRPAENHMPGLVRALARAAWRRLLAHRPCDRQRPDLSSGTLVRAARCRRVTTVPDDISSENGRKVFAGRYLFMAEAPDRPIHRIESDSPFLNKKRKEAGASRNGVGLPSLADGFASCASTVADAPNPRGQCRSWVDCGGLGRPSKA